MSALRVALANIGFASSPADSVARAVKTIEQASAARADILCFPECYIPGYRMPDVEMAPPDPAFLDQAWKTIAAAAGRANVAVILGTERVVDGGTRISTLVINRDGSIAGFQDKVQMDPSEEWAYTAGSGRRTFTVNDVRFGIAICHEGWRYPETVRASARDGAQIVFHPHYHPVEPGAFRPTTFGDPRNTFHETAVRGRAAENTIFFASVNYATEGSGTTSAIVDPNGNVIAWQPYGVEGLLVANLDLAPATRLLAMRLRPS